MAELNWLVRLAAVNNLTDQAALAKVAEEDKEPRVRKVAQLTAGRQHDARIRSHAAKPLTAIIPGLADDAAQGTGRRPPPVGFGQALGPERERRVRLGGGPLGQGTIEMVGQPPRR